jgi:hypothetical protein
MLQNFLEMLEPHFFHSGTTGRRAVMRADKLEPREPR